MSFPGTRPSRRSGGTVIAALSPRASAAEINAQIADLGATLGEREGGATLLLRRGVYELDASILVRNHVAIEGEGPGTLLRANPGFSGTAVIANGHDGDRRFAIRHLAIDAAECDYGVHLDTPDTPGSQEYADGTYQIDGVEVFDAQLDGFWWEGRGAGFNRNLKARDCGRYGYVIDAVDSVYDGLESGGSGSAGLVVRGSNNRIINSKMYYSGRLTAADGHGFWLDGASGGQLALLMNCESQDNVAHGFFLDEFHKANLIGVIAEGNNSGQWSQANQSANGMQVNGSSDACIEGVAIGRAGNPQQQRYAIGLTNGAENLKARLTSAGNFTGHIQNGWHFATDIRINNYDGNQDISYAASRTPNPTLGRSIFLGPLTGNITINNPAAANYAIGQEMTIAILQDGTGGRSVTWGSEYVLGGFTPTTTANRVNVYTFRRYELAWVLVSATAGLDFTSLV